MLFLSRKLISQKLKTQPLNSYQQLAKRLQHRPTYSAFKYLKLSSIIISSALLSSCFHLFEAAKTPLPIDVVLNESGKPVFYVDRYSLIKRYGIRGILITKGNTSACELTQSENTEKETIWGYEMATPVQEGVTLSQQILDELPKEITYGIIPPKVNQEVVALEKNTLYHANLSIVISRYSEVHSFRKGGLIFIIDDKGELLSKDLNAMCDLKKSLEKKKNQTANSSIVHNY